MSKRSKQFCPLPITVPKPTQHFGALAGGAFLGLLGKALDQAQLSEIEAMLAHPSATHLWAVIAIAMVGAWTRFAMQKAPRKIGSGQHCGVL